MAAQQDKFGWLAVCLKRERERERGRERGVTESCSTQRKSFVQQTITLVEQMPHQLPACWPPKSLSQGGADRERRARGERTSARACLCVRRGCSRRCLGCKMKQLCRHAHSKGRFFCTAPSRLPKDITSDFFFFLKKRDFRLCQNWRRLWQHVSVAALWVFRLHLLPWVESATSTFNVTPVCEVQLEPS